MTKEGKGERGGGEGFNNHQAACPVASVNGLASAESSFVASSGKARPPHDTIAYSRSSLLFCYE